MKDWTWVLTLAVIMTALTMLLATPTLAQTWDFAGSYSELVNPSGAWSYGYRTTLGDPFVLYTDHGTTPEGIGYWRTDPGYAGGGLFRNIAAGAVDNGTQWWEAGMGALHPGPDNAYATARWTAPAAAIVNISARFTAQSYGGGGTTTDAHVLKNGASLFVGDINGFIGRAANGYSDAFGGPTVQEYSGLTYVQPGDTIEFCVGYGANGTWSYDITGLSASITDIPNVGVVNGTVRGGLNGTTPLRGATVEATDGSGSTTTASDGTYQLLLSPGAHTLHTSHQDGVPREKMVAVVDNQMVACDFVLPVAGATYYVSSTGSDNNTGTSLEQAWRTISRGDALGVLAPGDVVFVAEGDYPQSSYLGVRIVNCGGISGAPITYKATGRAIIDQTSIPKPTRQSYGFRIEKSYIRVDGFEVAGAQWGAYINAGTSDITVANCVFHDMQPGDPAASDWYSWCAGVYQSSSQNALIHHNTFYSIGTQTSGKLAACVMSPNGGSISIHNNTFDGSWAGIYAWGGGSGGPDIRNNIIRGMWNYGIHYTSSIAGSVNAYNLFDANASDYGPYVSRGTGEFNADPGFIDGANRDYWLADGSTAIDKGVDLGYVFSGDGPDLGAYEGKKSVLVANLADLRSVSDGTTVRVTSPQVVTAEPDAFADGGYYVSEPTRVCGIKILPEPGLPDVSIGDRITFAGLLTTGPNDERAIRVNSITGRTSGQPLRPLGMAASSLTPSSGIDTTALLVRVWGRITEKTANHITISDGSTDGGVRIALDRQVTPPYPIPAVGQFTAVKGIASLALEGSVPVRVVCPRGMDDITYFHQTLDEATRAHNWVATYFGETSTENPFSFVYDGEASSQLLSGWTRDYDIAQLDDVRTQRTTTYTSPQSGLEVKCVSVEYADFPTVEWTVYLRNTGTTATPIIQNLLGIDTSIVLNTTGDYVLHHNRGTLVNRYDYEPLDTTLGTNSSQRFAPPGGRPCGTVFPYYNLERNGEGVIVVIGWPGQWSAEFSRDTGSDVRVRAGQETTYLRLLPGEEVRTPLIVMQFWNGNRTTSQNVWRQWMLAHNTPRPGGSLPPPQLPAVSGNQFPCLLCNEADEKLYIDGYLREGIGIDIWWMDAGWYWNNGCWPNTGTWEVDTNRFPDGLRGVNDYAHARGISNIVWFEPERVDGGTWLSINHPEWLLGGSLLNLGNPDAWNWLVNHIDDFITVQGIDHYRQDFNMDPLNNWRSGDAADRQGMSENKHVAGYLAYWDELIARHPSMLIDSCASGGHRNDLETLRRSVPLLRSDYIFDAVGEQCHSYGLWEWFPYTGTGFIDYDTYIFRSTMGPSTTLSLDARRTDLNYALLRHLVAEWRQVNSNYTGDFYRLTPYSAADNAWMGWQFHRPEVGKGMVQVFRRSGTPTSSLRVRLQGLNPTTLYKLTDMDTDIVTTALGSDLLDTGLAITIAGQPGSVLITYEEASGV